MLLKVTRKELDVLELLASNKKVNKVARILNIDRSAVWNRIKQAYIRNKIHASHSVVALMSKYIADGEQVELIDE